MSLSQLYTAEQAAERLGVPATWLAREARAERIPHLKLGRYVRFKPDDLEEWLQTRACGPRTGSRPVPARRKSR